jgi:hypothetical protein
MSAMKPTKDSLGLDDDGPMDIIAWYLERAGTRFDSAPLTREEERIARAAIGIRRVFRLKECFHNAQRIVLADRTKTLQYVEGYRTEAHIPLPVLHAWATLHGKVIDPTPSISREDIESVMAVMQAGILPVAQGVTLGTMAKGTSYVGVALPRRVFMRRRGDTTLDDWEHDFPFIQAYEKKVGCSYELPRVLPWDGRPPPNEKTPHDLRAHGAGRVRLQRRSRAKRADRR